MSTASTTISLEQRMLGEVEMVRRDRWEEIHRRAGGRVDSGDCSPAGPGPQDGAAMPAADGVEAVRAGDTVGDAAEFARRVPAGPGVRGRLLGAGPVPGVAAAGVPGQLRDGEAVRAAVAGGAVARGGDADAVRNAAGTALC